MTSSVTALTLAALLSPRVHLLFLDRATALVEGEWWRLLTGHLAHATISHFLLNLLLFVPFALNRERRRGSARFAGELLVIATSVSLGVRLLHPDWGTYQGLSGVVYGLIALVLVESRLTVGIRTIGFVTLVTKTAGEFVHGGWLSGGAAWQETLGVTYLPGSHLAGLAATACLLGLAALRRRGDATSARTIDTTPQESGVALG